MSFDAKSSDVKTPLAGSRPVSRTSSSVARERPAPTSDVRELHARLRADPRFNPPTPSPWKRAALLAAVLLLLWLAFSLRKPLFAPPEVVHAKRYSSEFKFRPAASPVITERMPDGRTRLRGAVPTIR